MAKSSAGQIADIALWGTLFSAPLVGGSVRAAPLLPIAVGAAIAYSAALIATHQERRSIHVFGLPLALTALALFALLQAIALPAGLLESFSPKAYALRLFVQDGFSSAPISYEPASSVFEAAKHLTYALIAMAVYHRVASRRSSSIVAFPIVAAASLSVLIAAAHRLLGLERFLGVVATGRPAREMFTTFVNPNHAAGFLVLATLVTLGKALSRRQRRAELLALAVLFAGLVLLTESRGGAAALLFGLVGFVALHQTQSQKPAWLVPGLLGGGILAWGGMVWGLEQSFPGSASKLHLKDKIAAVADALPMVKDHPWLGIGRGAFVSAYPRYKTSAVQLTFEYPENILVQLITEWGVIVGGLVLLGLGWALARRLSRASGAQQIGALMGVAAVLLHNLVDFSLEILGVAVPAVAILAAAAVRTIHSRSFAPKPLSARLTAVAVPVLCALGVVAASASMGTLAEDKRQVQTQIDRVLELRRQKKTADVRAWTYLEIVERHPANAHLAAQMAYLAEISEPPDLERALRWAQRALFLAPAYADGHLMVARLMLRAQRREEGFLEARMAWKLSGADRRMGFVKQIIGLSKSPEELLSAVPRRARLDGKGKTAPAVPAEWELIRATQALLRLKKRDWARDLLLFGAQEISETDEKTLRQLAATGLSAGVFTLSEHALNLLSKRGPKDAKTYTMQAELYRKTKRYDLLVKTLNEALAKQDMDTVPFLKMRIHERLRRRALPEARVDLERLRKESSPSPEDRSALAKLEARLERLAGRPAQAVYALDRAVGLLPTDIPLRLARARALKEAGRLTEALADLEYVLAQEPQNRAGKGLLRQVKSMTTPQRSDEPL